ncbi:tetratricopeptide repeat protein [Pararoseomonas indoligenes]|uniref:Tetratricopeptide repeat protein n=1 Tax=Roseomonas indoligenes TaxID=2820811 RepID=A0A940N603_9PROT|nr:tetratricopeptide repeat protein [Pararoseomonas indoligenes]MBP0494782.1 tetratricopeptide repeat protein [Pararoseomonas indoligenes]
MSTRHPLPALAAPAATRPGGRRLLPGGTVLLLATLGGAPVLAQTTAPAPGPATAASSPRPASPVPAAAADAGRSGPRGIAVLIDQANFWSAQGRPELAQQALDRLLTVDPNSSDVLLAAAEVAAQNGDRPTAEIYVARLRQMAPDSPQRAQAEVALRAASVDQAVLNEARNLAQAGQREAAMQRYRQLFPNGEVPAIFAAEYYQTLAGSSAEYFEEARSGLERAVARVPENRPLQLAYAQLLTYNETYRQEGARRLRALANEPTVGAAARAAWRQALLWLPSDPDTADELQAYLESNTGNRDAELEAKYEEAKATRISPSITYRLSAWAAMEAKNYEASERDFRSAIESDPQDAESYAGLALLRKIKGRYAEAREFFDKAVQLAPFREEDFRSRLGDLSGRETAPATAGRGTGGNGGRSGGGNAGPPSASYLAWQSLQRGQLERATENANRALRGNANEKLQGEIVLGLVSLRRNALPDAEARFRRILAARRNVPAAQAGLFEALQRQGRQADADRFLADSGFRPPEGALGSRSAALRQQAEQTRDPAAKIALLRGALSSDPNNVWVAFDLARALKASGDTAEARRIEAQLSARQGASDALFASALLANADGRISESVDRLEAIPDRARTADGNRLLDENRRVLEVRQLERAARGNPQSPAARRLLALAGEGDQTGETQAAVIRAFSRLRQTGNLQAASRTILASPPAAPAARVAVGFAMVEAGRNNDADSLIGSLDGDTRLTREQRQQVATLRANSAAQAAQNLNERGDRTEAMGRLSRALRDSPDNPQVQLSLARLYSLSGRAAEGQSISEGILSRDPDNVAARAVAGEAAVLNSDIGRAEQILREGRARNADELQMALLEARIARARRDTLRARNALEEAARLRGAQLRASAP